MLTVLGDNARALVRGRDRATGTVIFHPGYLAFCRDWGVQPRACAPYRARTKGKVESGVKFVKRNALAGRTFTSFTALEQHLTQWMAEADQRVHGTTHQRPCDRFVGDEQAALRPLPARPLPRREQRCRRRAANDAFVDVETVRYSVPYQLVRDHVVVAIDEQTVRIFHGADLVATHGRSREPFARGVTVASVDDTRYRVGYAIWAEDNLRLGHIGIADALSSQRWTLAITLAGDEEVHPEPFEAVSIPLTRI